MTPETAWRAFDEAAAGARKARILDLFSVEPDRLARMSVDAAGLHVDLSRQPWTARALDACLGLARACGVEAARDRMWAGEAVNASEGRAALHVALRAPDGSDFHALGRPVGGEVRSVRDRMRDFAEGVRSGALRGAIGDPIRAVVHIGIGGSDLGPRLVWDALAPADGPIEVRFAANIDPDEIEAALNGLDPRSTLVIVVSKTFTTQETLCNARAARAWLASGLGESADRHLVAVTAAVARAAEFGVGPERIFPFWDWVGGRYSLWSAVGLSCAVGLGWERFEALLSGAAEMDSVFRAAPLERNAPVLLALAQVFERDGMGRKARTTVPYSRRLRLLPSWLQQLEMESNGKSARADGGQAVRGTAPVVFGEPGTNAQHAYFQQLHQGGDVVPAEFVLVANGAAADADAHRKLLANGLAQAEALLVGLSESDVRRELALNGTSEDEIDRLAPQRAFTGDRPSTVILLDRLDARSLGSLLALYEHKTFVEGVIWGINSFDQWGVELGKRLAGPIEDELRGGPTQVHDPSTAALIARVRARGPSLP